jgi:release factor glutamine methyltransferase
MPETWTILKMLQWMSEYFSERSIDSPRLDAELLLAFALGLSRVQLYTQFDRPLNGEELEPLKKLVKRRASREPLAYIRGVREFFSLEFGVSPAVLVPRPETEILVEEAIQILQSKKKLTSPSTGKGKGEGGLDLQEVILPLIPSHQGRGSFEGAKILDVGTGSGCIAVALAKHLPDAEVWAVDVSPQALEIASLNAKKYEVDLRIHFLRWDLMKDSWNQRPEKFDLIVSNPPYIPSTEIETLAPELKFEPRGALDGGTDGFVFYRALIPWAFDHLQAGASLLLEMGEGQGQRLEEMAVKSGFLEVQILQDLAGHPRVLSAKRG